MPKSKYDAKLYIDKINKVIEEAKKNGLELLVVNHRYKFCIEAISPTSEEHKPYDDFKSSSISNPISNRVVQKPIEKDCYRCRHCLCMKDCSFVCVYKNKIITGANGQMTVNFTENCPDYKECT